jgi:large subunit ribosomal protein L28
MAKCAICDKKTSFGNQLSITRSHISKRSTRTVSPNLRRVKAIINGEPQKITVCAKCLRSGKVKRA